MSELENIEVEVAELVAQALSHSLMSPLNSIERRLGRIVKPAPSSGQLDKYNHHLANIYRTTQDARLLIDRKRDSIRENLKLKYAFGRDQFVEFVGRSLETVIIDVERSVADFYSFARPLMDTAKEKRLLETVRVSAQHFREIYRGIRRFVEHRGTGSESSCDVNNQLTLCLELIEARTKLALVEIFGKGKVQFDQTLLRTMFIEIITNSIKYARRGEKAQLRIEIEQPWAPDRALGEGESVRLNNPGNLCKISIADNGIGIPSDEIDSAMTLGFRSPIVRDTIAGSGSGLAICKLFTERAGGRIWITSEQFRGTVVHMVLPGSTTKTTAPSSAPQPNTLSQ